MSVTLSRRRGRLRQVTALATATVAAVALAACGGGSSAGQDGSLHMNVGVQSLVLQTYYPQLAQALGYFKDEKLDVGITVGESTANSVQGLIGGSIDAYLGGPEGVVASQQGADLKFVAAAANRSIWNVVAAPGTKSFADLAGKNIGVSALQSISTVTMRQALQANGVDAGKLNYIVAGGTAKRFAALQADRVAAVPLGLPVNYQASDSGGFVDMGNTNDIGAPPLAAAVVTVSGAWAQSHQEELHRFLRAYQRVINALYDPAMTQKLVDLTSKGLQVEPKYMEKAIKELFLEGPSVGKSMPKDSHIDISALQTSANAFQEFGALDHRVDPAPLVDMSYLENAQKSLSTNPPAAQ